VSDAATPSYSQSVSQNVFTPALTGSQNPINFLDRFPDELYDKSLDAHWVRFLYTILGPVGVGRLTRDALLARLALSDTGFDGFTLEKYYGDPFKFGRLLDERYYLNIDGVLTREEWETVKARDESYRSRALDYFAAARLGTSPEGMRLAAKSGLNHDVEIIENYRYNFDQVSDDPMGLDHFGLTYSNNEFIVVPRKEVSRSEVQVLAFEDTTITDGTFLIGFRGQTTPSLPYDIDAIDLETALESLITIGNGNVEVSGGPNPNAFRVYFMGDLSDQDVPEIEITSSLTNAAGEGRRMLVSTESAGQQSSTETVRFREVDEHAMQSALDRLRPVNSLPTFAPGPGYFDKHEVATIDSSSEYTEVIRYVTGTTAIPWPPIDDIAWIESGIEKQAPRIQNDLQHHYVAFHDIPRAYAYSQSTVDQPWYEDDVEHVITTNGGYLGSGPEQAVATFREYPSISVARPAGSTYTQAWLNGIYPLEYFGLPNVNTQQFISNPYWESGNQRKFYFEIDLGSPQAINFISFDHGANLNSTFNLEVDYDVLDDAPRREWHRVVPDQIRNPAGDSVSVFGPANPWTNFQLHLYDNCGDVIFTRFLRLHFEIDQEVATYLAQSEPGFIYRIALRSLRVGRNIV